MVLIDRSVTGGEKHYIGSTTSKLSTSFEYQADTYTRLNGYRKHIEGKSACFARFSTTNIDRTERRAIAPVERTELSRISKVVAKKHILSEEVLSYAEDLFETENAFLADACKERSTAQYNDENDDEENESTENVTEEVVILRQRDESHVFKYTPDSEKKTRPKITAQNLIQRIKAAGRHETIGAIAQNIFDIFSIEIPTMLLESVCLHTLFQKNNFHRLISVC